ncbi:hypothetical protein DL768_009627 [Monosporascus sp. mg162]|nr:hypothetical protein DL768_009627 [Monosporascus sp. mg162]
MASGVLKAWEECDKIDTLFVLVCTVFCWTIVPTVGIAYGGYSWRRNGLASAIPAVLTIATCSIQWFMIGYTLAYGEGGWVFGDFKYALHIGVLSEPVGTIPAILFSEFQLVFEATVCAIAVGGFCTPVHICSGASASAISLYLSYPLFRSRGSEKRTPTHIRLHRPGNSFFQLIALITIWGSWLAFDAGTTLALSFQSVMALCVTNLCASAGALTWACITYLETKKWSIDSTFMGAIAGLIMITPAAGFIDMPTAFCFGIFGALLCRQALRIKFTDFARRWRWVDNGDTFATHCVGGVAATICTGLFAQKEVAAYGGVEVDGGVFFDGNVRQLWVQVVEVLIGFEVLAPNDEINAGLDMVQTEETLCDMPNPDEEDYSPMTNGNIEL